MTFLTSFAQQAMCGRYALHLPAPEVRQRVEEQVGQRVGAWEDEDDYNGLERGFNIPPRSRNPVLRIRGGGDNTSSQGPEAGKDEETDDRKPFGTSNAKSLRMQNMQWGLVPHWMKRLPDSANTLKTINARDDTILEGGSMWKSVRGRKRCIVLAEGFYEWLKKGTERIPHHVKRKDGKLMCIAGMWDSVTLEGEKEPLYTYTIVTTNSNKQLNFLHDRMPVILDSAEDAQLWLDTSSQEWSKDVADLLKPFEGELECFIVPKEVGKVGQQSSDFLRPVAERKGNLSSFFAKQAAKSPERGAKPASIDDKAKKEHKSSNAKAEPDSADDKAKKDVVSSPELQKGKRKNDDKLEEQKPTAKKTKKEEPQAEEEVMVLNPDEGDKVAESTAGSRRTDSKASKTKTKTAGNASKPIVLEISDDSDANNEEPSPGGKHASAQTRMPDDDKYDVDSEGNAKITSFFNEAG